MRVGSRTGRAVLLLSLAVLVLLAAAVLALPDDATAKTIQVPEDEATIQAAIDEAGYGDTVLLNSGEYDEHVHINKVITLKGIDDQAVWLTSTLGDSVIEVQGHDVTISGLRIDGKKGKVGIRATSVDDLAIKNVVLTSCERGIVLNGGSNIVVRGCKVRNSVSGGLYITGSYDEECEGVSISDSNFENNRGPAIDLTWCQGVSMDRLSVTGNGGRGVLVDHVDNSHLRNSTLEGNGNGLELVRSHGWSIEDNAIRKNRWNGIELNLSGGARANVIRNNIISANSQADGSSAAGIFFNGGDASRNQVAGNTIAGNPYGLHFYSTSGFCRHNTFRLNTIRDSIYGVWESAGTGPNYYYLNQFEDNNVQVGECNADSVFDDGELGNYWSDYGSQYPGAKPDGAVWAWPYTVSKRSTAVDSRPLAYTYEQDPPVVSRLVLVSVGTLIPGATATFEVDYTDASGIDGYEWTMRLPSGLETTYTTDTYWFMYTFERTGIHVLTVKVVDVWGLSASRSLDMRVEDKVPPVAVAGLDIIVNLDAIVTLDATGSSDNHEIADISWLFDPDGEARRYSNSIVSLRMTELGTFVAVLYVVDPSGNSASDTLNIFVKDLSPPVAKVPVEDTMFRLGETGTFDGSSSDDNVGIVLWTWTVFYGGRAVLRVWEADIGYTFDKMGVYRFELTVKDAAGHSDSVDFSVTVRDTEPPVARAGGDRTVAMGETVIFNGGGSTDNIGITRHWWSFNYQKGMQSLTGKVASFQFDLPGEYTVRLVVYDESGNHGSDTLQVSVMDIEPPVAQYWVSEEVELGQEVVMDASGSGDNVGIAVIEWRVSHGGATDVVRGAMLVLPIDNAGTYNVTLVVRDAAGNEDTEDCSFYIAPETSEANAPAWLVPGMVAIIASAMLLGHMYARKRYRA